jgi:GNAT superfamily N-acetyltransferase
MTSLARMDGDIITPRDGLSLSLEQFSGAWRAMCNPSEGYTQETDEHVEFIFSGIPIGFFNIALVVGEDLSAVDLHVHAARACAWAAEQNVPWMCVVTHDLLAPGVDAATTLQGLGLVPVMPLTGMVTQTIVPPTRLAGDIHLAIADTAEQFSAMLDVNAIAYGMPLDAGKPLVSTAAFWDGHVPVLGHVQDTPASCAAVLMVDGCRYVALVATDPGHQRRGYAEAAMRHALEAAGAAYGYGTTVLHATDAGKPIYERMGYRAVSSHTAFMETRFLGEH